MTWYAASIIIAFIPIERGDEPILVHENVFLIEAANDGEVMDKAKKIGEEDATPDDTLTINGKPAKTVFVGVRKIIRVSNPWPYDPDQDRLRPTDGTEITYSVFQVADDEALSRLGKGEEVEVDYFE